VDVCLVIKHRLEELGLDQRDLAAAAQVTESYVSQLLTRRKAPPAVDRTDLYERMNSFLKLPKGQLSKLVRAQRTEELKKKLADPPAPLFEEVRELIIRKCRAAERKPVRDIFEKQAFGELERLVTQKLLDVAKGVARIKLKDEEWLRRVAKLRSQSYVEIRAMILEFLDTDVFSLTINHCEAFLEPLIVSWAFDLKNFSMEIFLNKRLSATQAIIFQFLEARNDNSFGGEPGLKKFLRNPAMSGDATPEEIDFLKSLRFQQKRPSALYYYRELQSLRDPIHFPDRAIAAVQRPWGRRIQ
jgi:transcriptional regulator with XRE-family HTH domain